MMSNIWTKDFSCMWNIRADPWKHYILVLFWNLRIYFYHNTQNVGKIDVDVVPHYRNLTGTTSLFFFFVCTEKYQSPGHAKQHQKIKTQYKNKHLLYHKYGAKIILNITKNKLLRWYIHTYKYNKLHLTCNRVDSLMCGNMYYTFFFHFIWHFVNF